VHDEPQDEMSFGVAINGGQNENSAPVSFGAMKFYQLPMPIRKWNVNTYKMRANAREHYRVFEKFH